MIRRFSQWTVFFISIIGVAGILFYIQHAIEAQANRAVLKKAVVVQHPDVSVITAIPGSYRAEIKGYGSASPHFELTLAAQVSGQIVSLSADFETGHRIKNGDLLALLDETDYRAAVITAERNLSDARLAFLEEERQALQAEAEWKSSGMEGEPASDLVLRKPQLAAAKAAVTEAEANLESARKNLEKTHITAPFDAVVIERLVAPGSFVQPGTSIATIYSADRVEIAVALSAADWADLPGNKQLASGEWPAELHDTQTGQSWYGYVLRSEQHQNTQSRQRNLILAVDHPLDSEQPLLPGVFVQVKISGRSVDNLWRLPGSAFSQKGEIWYVAENNTLAAFSANPLFSDADAVYIVPPESLTVTPQKILVHPLNSYLKGMMVNPVEELNHEQ